MGKLVFVCILNDKFFLLNSVGLIVEDVCVLKLNVFFGLVEKGFDGDSSA